MYVNRGIINVEAKYINIFKAEKNGNYMNIVSG